MAVQEVARTAEATGGEHVVTWVEENLGGTVVAIERLARWRVGWYLDLERDGEILRLYARGERGPDFPSPFPLDHEVAVHDMFEANGVRVPHVYGLVDGGPIRVIIMDRADGVQGLEHAASDADRRRLLSECTDQMVRVHQIGHDELRARGFVVPTDPADIAMSQVFRSLEAAYLAQPARDPAIEFLRLWLERNRPRDRDRAAFVTWDSAQFLHHAGELTALIDFELAHVGDPYMDLAPLRTRDSIEPLGDLATAFERYAELTGEAIDLDVVRYFEISQLTVTLMLQWPVICDPDPASDYVTHLIWYIESARYAFDIMTELTGVEVDEVGLPVARRSASSPAHAHLVRSLRQASRREAYDGWRARCDYRLARHLQRVDEIGAELERQDQAEIAALLGTGAPDLAGADEQLVGFIGSAGPEHDAALHVLLARRAQRQTMTLGPADSLIVRHPPLQPLPGA